MKNNPYDIVNLFYCKGVKTLKELSDFIPALDYGAVLKHYKLLQKMVSGKGGYTNAQRLVLERLTFKGEQDSKSARTRSKSSKK